MLCQTGACFPHIFPAVITSIAEFFAPQNWHSNSRRAQSIAMSYTFSLCPRSYVLYLRQLLSNQTVTAMANEMYYNGNIHQVGGYSSERVHNSVTSWRFGLRNVASSAQDHTSNPGFQNKMSDNGYTVTKARVTVRSDALKYCVQPRSNTT